VAAASAIAAQLVRVAEDWVTTRFVPNRTTELAELAIRYNAADCRVPAGQHKIGTPHPGLHHGPFVQPLLCQSVAASPWAK
jgi:hypothetical protein